MLARRLADEYYDYEEYNEEVQRPQPKLRAVKKTEQPTALNTRLRSRCRMLFVLFAVLAMAVTVRSGISASRGYALVAVQTQAQTLEQENERLRVEIAKLKSPQRIRTIAETELGMQTPQKVYFAHEK